jgi:uncharacterized protein with von Willebrand factor type A (vWA) domain
VVIRPLPAGTETERHDPVTPSDFACLAVAFSRVLSSMGCRISHSSVLLYAEALGMVGLGDPASVYVAGEATLIHEPSDRERYGRAFAAFYGTRPPFAMALGDELPPPLPSYLDEGRESPTPLEDRCETAAVAEPALGFSAAERLSEKDFAECTEEELATLLRAVASLRCRGPRRPSRRLSSSARRGGEELDLRRVVSTGLATDGELLRLSFRVRGTRPRRVVLLLDVSGSMDPYTRPLLHLAHTLRAAGLRLEVFTLGTRCVRITRELGGHDPDAALARVARVVRDLGGGTRLGSGIAAFNQGFGLRGLARGAVVAIVSDGWDRGDPAVLGEAMGRLRRVAHRIVWVNPLKTSPGYEPLARGMATALPFVDDFLAGSSLDALGLVAEALSR